jgi:hypothetical protein
MWAQTDGPTPAERFSAEGVYLQPSKKDRKAAFAEIRARLAGNPALGRDGQLGDHPMLFISARCKHWWRTVPGLTLDEIEPEKGPDSRLEDHCYDEMAYALRGRPYIMTEPARVNEEMRGLDTGGRKMRDSYDVGW